MVQNEQKKRGRPFAVGEKAVRVAITVPADLRQKLSDLGGSAWITQKLREAQITEKKNK